MYITFVIRKLFFYTEILPVKVAQSCPTICDPMDCTVHGILQARTLEWVTAPFSRRSSQLRGQTQVSRVAGGFLTSWATREAQRYSLPHLFVVLRLFFIWTIFKVCTKFVTTLLLFYILVFWPLGMWDLSSPARDWTCSPYIGRWSLNHWTTREVSTPF